MPKPKYLPVKPDDIPQQLREMPWAVWEAEQDDKGKWTKPPCNADGYKISTNKPAQWSRFDEVRNALAGFDGAGVLIQRDSDIRAIDLDVIDKLIPAKPEVGKLLNRARKEGVYCEKSPSGTGLRLFVRAPWTLGKAKTNVRVPGDWPEGEKTPGVELFGQGFVTVTGVPAWKDGTIQAAQWLLDGLLALEQPDKGGKASQTRQEAPEGFDLGAMVEQIAKASEKRLPALWAGDWQGESGDLGAGVGEYPGQSEADFALACEIARQARKAGVPGGQLAEIIEQVFSRCGLAERDKWTDRADYRERTVQGAIDATRQESQGEASGDDAKFANGQLRLSRIFAKRYQEVLKHDHARKKWVRFDGPRWQVCEKAEHEEQIKQGAEDLLDKAAELIKSDPNSPANKLRMKFAMDCQQQRNIRAIAELMKSDPLQACTSTDFDQDPDILGCANGYINLRTGELAEPDPAAMVSQIAPVTYDPDARAPRWLRFLDEVLDGDKEVVGLMQRLIGYAATGYTTDEILAIWYGLGANGKSVLGDTLARVLGDYAFMAPPSMILKQDDGRIRNDLAALAGKRLVSLNELPAGGELDAQTVKLLAGREPITARFLYGEYFTYQPTATPIVRTNHRPIVREMTAGMWRRLVLIPFRRQFDITKGKDLEQKLWAERSGILAWIVEGAIQWHREGLNIPPVIQAEVQAYRDESDIFGQFLSEYIIPSAGGKVQSFDLWGRWREFCAAEGIKDGSRQSFGRRVSEYGYSAKSSNGTRYFSGMELRNKVPSLSVVR